MIPPPPDPEGALSVGFVLQACAAGLALTMRAAPGRCLLLFKKRLLRFIPSSPLRFERSIGVSSSASAVFYARTASSSASSFSSSSSLANKHRLHPSLQPPSPSRSLHPFSSSSSEQALCSFLSCITQSAHALGSPASPPLFRGVSGKHVMIVFANLFVCTTAPPVGMHGGGECIC